MHAGKVTVDMLMLRRLTSPAGNTWCILNVSGRIANSCRLEVLLLSHIRDELCGGEAML